MHSVRKLSGWFRTAARLTQLASAMLRLGNPRSGSSNAFFPFPTGVGAVWLHQTCRRMLRIFGIQSTVVGAVPSHGLLVANHLSYVDIILLSSLTPCVFV